MNWFDLKWKSHAFIDRWSFVHVSWGFIFGLGFEYTQFAVLTSLLLVCALLVLWEIFEAFIGFGEGWVGVLSDIIVGILGFFVGFYILSEFHIVFFPLLGAITLVTMVMVYRGWQQSV